MDHTRHINIFRADKISVTMVGAGGIGAFAALALTKMGIMALAIIDNDVVSDENIPVQLHRLADVGRYKVDGLQEVLDMFSDDTDIETVTLRIDETYTLRDQVIISAVDSIKARHDIWKSVKRGGCKFYLDARMASQEFHLYCVDMDDFTWYEQMLSQETDGNVSSEPCTSKSTVHCGMIAGGLIADAVKQIAQSLSPQRVLVFNILKKFIFSQE